MTINSPTENLKPIPTTPLNCKSNDLFWTLTDRTGRPAPICKNVWLDLQEFRLPHHQNRDVIWKRPAENGFDIAQAKRAVIAALDLLGCRARFEIDLAPDGTDAFIIRRLRGNRPLPARLRQEKALLSQEMASATDHGSYYKLLRKRVALENSCAPGQPLVYQPRGRARSPSKHGWENLRLWDQKRFQESARTLQNACSKWKRTNGIKNYRIRCSPLLDGSTNVWRIA